MRSERAAPEQQMVEKEQHDRAHYGHEHAVEVQAGHACCAEEAREDKAAHERADDAKAGGSDATTWTTFKCIYQPAVAVWRTKTGRSD